MLAAFVLTVVLAPATNQPIITPAEAKDHVGQNVVVKGWVVQINESENGDALLLNFGALYPDQVFSAVIHDRSFSSFPDARSWTHKLISVQGKIQLYKGQGKPEIILQRQDQVRVDPDPLPPQDALPEKAIDGAGGGTARGDIAPVMGFDSPPSPIKSPRPQYPQEAFINKIEGTVLVEILIDSQGRVAKARVVQSVPLLDAAALQTVYGWEFVPAMKHGKPVPTLAHIPVTFRISSKAPEHRKQRPPKDSG
jgi:TonB family protein